MNIRITVPVKSKIAKNNLLLSVKMTRIIMLSNVNKINNIDTNNINPFLYFLNPNEAFSSYRMLPYFPESYFIIQTNIPRLL